MDTRAAWAKFWSKSWLVKGPALAVAAFIALAIFGGILDALGGDEEPTAASPQETATTGATAASTSTNVAPTDTVAAPTDTPAPPTAPEPTATTASLSTEEQFAKSYRDNKGFMPLAADDGLKVTWEPAAGLLTFDIYRDDKNTSTGATLHVGGSSALIANRAIWTTYPAVNVVTVQMWEKATNTSTGQTVELIATRITNTRATAERYDYDGMKNLQIADNKRFFCASDEYQIALHIYNDIGDKGCLAQWGLRKDQ